VPYADMFNHRHPEEAKYVFDRERNGFSIIALEDIPKGEEVCIQYNSNISNSNLFFSYGFVF
jgi:SET domain-containing protein